MIPEISVYETHPLPLHAAAACAHFNMIPETSMGTLAHRCMLRQSRAW
jgi:hypothetical protein